MTGTGTYEIRHKARNTSNGRCAAYVTLPSQRTDSPPVLKAGTFSIYRLYSIGEEIDLALAMTLLQAPTAHRRQSSGVRQADSIQIAQPPLRLELGSGSLSIGSLTLAGTRHATIYDLG